MKLEPQNYTEIKNLIEEKIKEKTDFSTFETDKEAREHLRKLFVGITQQLEREHNLEMSERDKEQLYEAVVISMLDVSDFGPLEVLLEDRDISAIMVNGVNTIYAVKNGKMTQTDLHFEDHLQLMRIINAIAAPLGRVVNESHPVVDLRLADGTLVNIVIPPIALNGPTLTLQKMPDSPLSWDNIIEFGSLTPKMHDFLRYCVEASLTICISGGVSSGKTTILNAISEFISDDERVITVENRAEIQLRNKHVVRLESRPPNLEGKGEVSIADLLLNALRMRPERIITGEVQGDEAWYMMQAVHLGHRGSMFTIHANNPRDALERLEVMSGIAAKSTPISAIRSSIGTNIDVIVQINRMTDGKRRITNIAEVVGLQNNQIVTQDIFEFIPGDMKDGKLTGEFKPTGVKPTFLNHFEYAGIELPDDFFDTSE